MKGLKRRFLKRLVIKSVIHWEFSLSPVSSAVISSQSLSVVLLGVVVDVLVTLLVVLDGVLKEVLERGVVSSRIKIGLSNSIVLGIGLLMGIDRGTKGPWKVGNTIFLVVILNVVGFLVVPLTFVVAPFLVVAALTLVEGFLLVEVAPPFFVVATAFVVAFLVVACLAILRWSPF